MRWFRLPPRPEGIHEAWSLEVQIHPANIRRRVRYLFLSRRQVTLWSIPALAYMAFLALGLWSAPAVIGRVLHRQEYSSLVAERSQQGERLQDLVSRLAQVEQRTDGLHLRMNKILLAYGLPPDKLAVRPLPVQEAPDSIYAGTIHQGSRLQARIGQRLGAVDTHLRAVRTYEQANQE